MVGMLIFAFLFNVFGYHHHQVLLLVLVSCGWRYFGKSTSWTKTKNKKKKNTGLHVL